MSKIIINNKSSLSDSEAVGVVSKLAEKLLGSADSHGSFFTTYELSDSRKIIANIGQVRSQTYTFKIAEEAE